MSTVTRTLRNLRRIGFKEYAHQMQNIGDTKAGTYIASDRYGNKYYENLEEELPCLSNPIPNALSLKASLFFRGEFGHGGNVLADVHAVRTRWVDYKQHEFSPYVLAIPFAFLLHHSLSSISNLSQNMFL